VFDLARVVFCRDVKTVYFSPFGLDVILILYFYVRTIKLVRKVRQLFLES
jgi:hypothetical protein